MGLLNFKTGRAVFIKLLEMRWARKCQVIGFACAKKAGVDFIISVHFFFFSVSKQRPWYWFINSAKWRMEYILLVTFRESRLVLVEENRYAMVTDIGHYEETY